MPSPPTPDWRDDAGYGWLVGQDRSAWGWEWLRRDPTYRRRAIPAIGSRTAKSMDNVEPDAESWGLHRFEDPRLDARRARPVWTAQAWPHVLTIDAKSSNADGFDIMLLGDARLVTGRDCAEHWLEFQGG